MTTDFGPRGEANSVAIDSRDRIVAAGYSCTSNSACDFALARYNPSGPPDESFSGDGKLTTDFGRTAGVYSVAIDSRDRIVAAGFGQRHHRYGFALARYARSGRLDAAFSRDGKVITSFKDPTSANSVAIDSRGRIVAAGPRYSRPLPAQRSPRPLVLGQRQGDPGLGFLLQLGGDRPRGPHRGGRRARLSRARPLRRLPATVIRWPPQPNASVRGRLALTLAVLAALLAPVPRQSERRRPRPLVRRGRQGDDEHRLGFTRVRPPWWYRPARADRGRRRIGKATIHQVRIARYKRDGSLDRSFSGNGRVRTSSAAPAGASSVAIDSRGRIVAAGVRWIEPTRLRARPLPAGRHPRPLVLRQTER